MKLFKKLNQAGIAHLAVLVIVVVGLAAVGTYMLVASRAATCVDYVYGYGGSGTCVKYVQTLANHKLPYIGSSYPNPILVVDGQYGTQTKNGILKIQKAWGLTQDGIVGPQTWKALCSSGTVRQSADGPFSPAEKTAYNNAGCSKFYGSL